mgnify:FL=1
MIQDQDDAGASAPVSAALTARAVDLHKQHLFAEALPLYRHARILDPGDPAGMHFQGLVEIRIGDMPHGLVLLARSRRLSPDQPGLTENIANILPVIWARTSPTLPTPFWDCATVAATAALQPPGDFLARLRTRVSERWQAVAFAHYRDGRMDEAHALLKPVTETIDDDLCLLNLYAVVQRRRGNLGDAFNILKTCYRISPSDDMVMLNLASVLQEIGHQEAALDCYQTLAHIALDHFNGFRLEKAESICRNLVHLVPTLRNPWIILGLTLSRLGRQEEAAATMATAIRVDPGYVPPYTFYGDALRLSGHVEKAERAYRQAAALDPMSAEAIGGVGLACLDQEREEEARRLLERSQWLKSQISSTSSALSCLRLRQSAPAGTRFPRRARSGRGVLSVSSLNSYGRLAHTFYDYISTRIYAEKYGLEVETPEWAGALLFDLDDPLMSKPQRSILLDHDGFRARFRDGLLHDTPDPIQGVDVFLGWPVMELTEIAAHRTVVQSWMRPRALWDPWLRPAVDRLDAMGETIVAVHIRRTDRSLEGGVDFPAYRAWLGQMWDTLHRPVLLVATDDPSVLPEFAPFAPHTLRSLAEPWKGLEHLQDFHLLMNADVVALSYGGFARLAAAFGTRARLVVEPDRATGGFRRVTVWE